MSQYNPKQVEFIRELRKESVAKYGEPVTKDQWDKIANQYNTKNIDEIKRSGNALRKIYAKYENIDFNDDTIFASLQSKRSAENRSRKLAKENRVVLDKIQEQKEFLAEFKEIIAQTQLILHPIVPPKEKSKATRTIVAHISDTHLGINISKGEMHELNEFNKTIAARRLAYFFQELVNYKLHHRAESDLVIVLNGDVMAGVIHDQEWGVDRMSTQMACARSLLAQGISYVSQHYKKVTVVCETGNHDRFIHKENKGRQASAKWDSYATILYGTLKDLFKFAKYENVEFIIPESPYTLIDIQSHTFFITHGDTVINVANPGKKLDMEKLINTINKINVGLMEDSKKTIKGVLLGHLHIATTQELDNGTVIMINGSLSGLDPFAQSLGIFGNNPSQQIFEVTEKHVIGDMRNIRVKKADNDESLDLLIKPFVDLF